MKVYRLQNERGTGAYGRGIIFDHCNVRHPAPLEDSKLKKQMDKKLFLTAYGWFDSIPNNLFGFESIKQFKTWFFNDEWINEFHEHGYAIYVYEVSADHVAVGSTQVVFRIEQATLIAKRPLTKYIENATKNPPQ